MNRFLLIIFSILLISISSSKNRIDYLDPVPGAEYVNTENSIIVGLREPLQMQEHAIENIISVTGTKSGEHKGNVVISAGGSKIIFKPVVPYTPGEDIYVSFSGKLSNAQYRGKNINSYSFTVTASKINVDDIRYKNDGLRPSIPEIFTGDTRINLPRLNILVNTNPSPGYLFTSPYFGGYFLLISNSNGTPYWYKYQVPQYGDFKKQPNGNLTYYNIIRHTHYEMNSNYNIVDSFYCGNGYQADIHELRVINNRHALLMAYDPQIVDMSLIVPGGNPHATVIGLIIQEIDQNKNVVFQWRSWDHFLITDAQHVNLLDSIVDYVHGNAIESDDDGNILISSRHMNEISKISTSTGNFIWRFGGPHNEFTFTNDPIRFTYQHAVRRLTNGNLTLFDNGNYHTPHFSRAVEYSLNTSNHSATLVWQYRKTPDVYGFWGGYVQRLSNGNTLISWGGTQPTITEVKPDGTIVYEAAFQMNVFTYRAYKFDWSGAPLAINNLSGSVPASFKLYQNFPNPFNPETQIIYDVPNASNVNLSVYDITGRKVAEIVSGYRQPGSYRTSFDGTNFSSGLYFYRFSAGNYTETRKMILIK